MRDRFFLYVEDDPLSREVMQMLAENVMELGELILFEDSTDFMVRVQQLPKMPDLFLLDIHVQPHNGFEMLRMLRENSPTYGGKVIALTASVMNEEVEKLRASGFDGAIAKPLSAHTFPSLIERILNGESVWYIAN